MFRDRKPGMMRLVLLLLSLLLWGAVPARAQDQGLQDLCAPIALYPDPLLSNVLVASTYPAEVAAAAQWMQRTGPIDPASLDSALSGQGWDPAVKSLVAFPDVLNYMANNMAWVTDLGNAYLSQPNDVFDAIQSLRLDAQNNGNLVSNQYQTITYDNGAIVIEASNPDQIYVPSYDPNAVYYDNGPGISWGIGINVGNSLWFGVPLWSQHRLFFGRGYNNYYGGRGGRYANSQYYRTVRNDINRNQGAWRFNNQHRGGLAVPNASQARQGRGYNSQTRNTNRTYHTPNTGFTRGNNQTRGNGRFNGQTGTNNQTRGNGRFNGQTGNNNQTRVNTPQLGQPNRSVPTTPVQSQNRFENRNNNGAGGFLNNPNRNRPTQLAQPTRTLPSIFNVGSGSQVNQESNRGAQSRSYQRPTPVRPVEAPQVRPQIQSPQPRMGIPQMSRPVQQAPQRQSQPMRSAPSPQGRKRS